MSVSIIGFFLFIIIGIILLIVGSNLKKKSGICEECGNVVKNGVCQNCGNPITNKNKTISSLCIVFGWLTLIGNILLIFVNMFLI